MPNKISFSTSYAGQAPSFLSSAIAASGLVFVSGSCGVEQGVFVQGDVKDRATVALKRIQSLLQARGLGMEDVVSSTVYLSKYVQDYDSLNEAYLQAFPQDIKPTRTCVGASALPSGTDVEITCIAVEKSHGPIQKITSPELPDTLPFLSPALSIQDLVFVSGQCAEDGGSSAHTVNDRTKSALGNVRVLLKQAGLGLEDVISSTVYLTKYKEDFNMMNQAYIQAFTTGSPFPTRTCIGLERLPGGTDVEITCIAAKRNDGSGQRVRVPINVPSLGAVPPFLSSNILAPKAKLYYLSGTTGVGTDGTVSDRTRAALENIKTRLVEVGLGLSDVVSSTIYLSNYVEDFGAMNKAYTPFFPTDPPSRTCIGIKDLPQGTDVEITCVAALREPHMGKTTQSAKL
ncbi:Putative translation initiation inhibitor UK114/IBM1 [Phaffia rhodozyma]|uniref:Putative translation initiation inhibitor UK114/IBM1 n=1 Tax=Phaffia rhodozyma TaxID=264483 RepID=A0A0F7SP12_PHARH|nr:Putative translation initiation inhibitor UK114/IBM1 [Phaffia rhodozyma]